MKKKVIAIALVGSLALAGCAGLTKFVGKACDYLQQYTLTASKIVKEIQVDYDKYVALAGSVNPADAEIGKKWLRQADSVLITMGAVEKQICVALGDILTALELAKNVVK